MSKRDRQGVRTAADIERKYDLGKLDAFRGDSQKQGIVVSELTQKVDQFIANTNGDIGDINGEIADINERLNNIGPAISPTIDFTDIEGGYRVILTDANGVETFDVMNGKDGTGGGTTSWENIINKPDTFPPSEHTHNNKLLWSGHEIMGDGAEITLAESIANQTTGVVFVFYPATASASNRHNVITHFKSKCEIATFGSIGHTFPLFRNNFSQIGTKYLYTSNTKIKGHSMNTNKGTTNGVTFDNEGWVLCYVIGV